MKKRLTSKIINKIRLKNDKDFFINKINEILDLQFEQKCSIDLKSQSVGNCVPANLKAAEFVVLQFLGAAHENSNIQKHISKITKEIYKSYTSFLREYSLETYFKSLKGNPQEIDWLLLAQIRIQLDRKIAKNKFIGAQEENFKKALEHFKTYITPEMCQVTKENINALLHYLIAIDDRSAIGDAYNKKLFEFTSNYGGTTPLQTAIKTRNIELI